MNLEHVREYAAEQHDVVADWELHELGLNPIDIDIACDRGELHEVVEGVFSTVGADVPWVARCMAATLAVPGSAISHGTAAMLHGLLPVDEARDIEVTVAQENGEQLAIEAVARRADDRALLRAQAGCQRG